MRGPPWNASPPLRVPRAGLRPRSASRGPGSAPFYKLQCWHQGKNQTRYVPADEVPALQRALAGHQRFQALADEFVDLTVARTRASDAKEGKKNSRNSKPNATRKPKPS